MISAGVDGFRGCVEVARGPSRINATDDSPGPDDPTKLDLGETAHATAIYPNVRRCVGAAATAVANEASE